MVAKTTKQEDEIKIQQEITNEVHQAIKDYKIGVQEQELVDTNQDIRRRSSWWATVDAAGVMRKAVTVA